MTPLFHEPGPRVFALPPGVDFTAEIAAGLRARLADQPPEALARVRIAVNTRRTLRALSEAFETTGDAVFLPRLSLIEAFAAGAADGPPPVPRLTRRLALTKLMLSFLLPRPELGPASAAEPLAAALIDLFDELHQERVDIEALRETLDADAHAAHWRAFSAFFTHIAEAWPAVLAEELGQGEPDALRAADVSALIAEWEAAPTQEPIIAAGSTGSQRITAELLAAVARLPQGAVLLPGFDFAMDPAAWEGMGPEHPQYGFRRLLGLIGLSRADVIPWSVETAPSGPERARLLSQALRPAPATHEWRAARQALGAEAAAATGAVALIEAPNPRREAEAAALIIRDAMAEGAGRVALVTPDRTLGRRVRAALARWGVTPDESGGAPLTLTPPGVFLTLTAGVLARPFDPAALLALLKHPLIDRPDGAAFRRAVARLELKGLRNRNVALGLDSIAAILRAEIIERADDDDASPRTAPLAERALAERLTHLAPWSGAAPLAELVARHLAAAEALAGGALWDKAAGEAARDAMRALEDASTAYGEAETAVYPALLASALREVGDVRDEAFVADPRVRILGPLEARAQSAEVMILGGLNEGTWPQSTPVDPWLSRPMRAALGLPAPERRIGLSAHDFLQAASAPRVVLTRARRADGAPTVEARWLTRLKTLLAGVAPDALAGMQARGDVWLTRAAALDHAPERTPENRPAPKPPVDARPRVVTVTEVERLIRDPYDVYARRVLKLSRLDPLGAAADARLRGEVLHKVMETFISRTMGGLPDDSAALFDEVADEVIARSLAPPVEAIAWRRRLERVKDWFLKGEAARRAAGTPLGVEVKGELTLDTAGGAVTLKGRADRIDGLAGGGLAIYDYKAGGAPTQKQANIFAKQLPLLAAMAESGALEGAPEAAAPVLAYLSLSGAEGGGKETPIKPEPGALDKLRSLLDAYFDTDQPYLPRAYVERQSYPSDYEHLSRYGEWDDPTPTGPPTGGGS